MTITRFKTMSCIYRVLFYCMFVSNVMCLNFNEKYVTRFSLGNNKTYFGYTVLLQRGSKPMVIVGAPKADPVNGGSIYSCTLDSKCEKYPHIHTYNKETFTSNFLGSSLDGSDLTGEEIIVCSPRKVIFGGASGNTYQKGLCFYQRNSTAISSESPLEVNPLKNEYFTVGNSRGNSYYDYAFAEAGLSLHRVKSEKSILLGAPGVKKWSGSVVVQSLADLESLTYTRDYYVLPQRSVLVEEEAHGYLGYSVTSGHFQEDARRFQPVIGGPRANELLGLVLIFNGGEITNKLTSDESGSYYGAAVLAVDIDNDGIDELLVGAPLGSGSTYDQGYVHYYGNNFQTEYKLVGSQKTAAMFGSAMASLGDIDYDSFKDVAISAPYEDDGVGAVYIYMGSRLGIQEKYSQRLSPLVFNGGLTSTRGFGLGLSRGNDLDGNGHNDFAVGAYRSGEVFFFNGLPIIDYKLTLKTNASSFISGDYFKISYCLKYTQRSPKQDQKSADFNVELVLDYRTEVQNYFETNLTVFLRRENCQEKIVRVMDVVDLMPYELTLKVEILSNVVALGKDVIKASIPYSHGCGDDNICQTNVNLTPRTNTTTIVVSKDREVNVSILAENTGEPGFRCQLIIATPDKIELSQNSLCTVENDTYLCPFASNLTVTKEVTYRFDVSTIGPNIKEIEIDFEIQCLGENSADGKTKAAFLIVLENSPFIEGKSDPEKIYFQRTQPEDFEVTHLFSVGNGGPSPVKLDVVILLPIVKYQNKNIFDFSKVTYNGFQHDCTPRNNTKPYHHILDTKKIVKEPLNDTVVYDSFIEGIEHIEIFCTGDYLQKSSQTARYEVTFTVKTKLISDMYKDGVLKENVVAYITSAFLSNSDHTIEAHTVTSVISTGEKPTYLWIYIVVGVILGIIFLGLLTFLLYKCHFFERSLKDKMNDDNLVNATDEPNKIESEDELNTEEEKLDASNDEAEEDNPLEHK